MLLLLLPGNFPEDRFSQYRVDCACRIDRLNVIVTAVVACVAGVRKGRGRELGRDTTREGGESYCFRHPA